MGRQRECPKIDDCQLHTVYYKSRRDSTPNVGLCDECEAICLQKSHKTQKLFHMDQVLWLGWRTLEPKLWLGDDTVLLHRVAEWPYLYY